MMNMMEYDVCDGCYNIMEKSIDSKNIAIVYV